MKKNSLVLGSLAFALTVGIAPSALAQKKGYSLPPNAQKIEPGAYYLGRVKDRAGREVDGIAFVHPRKQAAKPEGGGGGGKPNSCYSFLASGARWKTSEPFVIDPSITSAIPDGEALINGALAEWENAAGKPIFGLGTLGEVSVGIGSGINDVNEVTFGPIADPGVIAVTFVWGVFGGPPAGRELVEWDMILDDVDFAWSNSGATGQMDFLNIFAHESGHAAGLGHPSSSCTEETMYAYADLGETKKQTLNAGDIAGIRALYK